MNIIYITVSLPYGAAEPFSIVEIDALRRLGHEVTVVPANPSGDILHVARNWADGVIADKVLSPAVVRVALQRLRKRNGCLTRALSLIRQSRNTRIFAKNVAVLPKGLWLADLAERTGADHIHANWASTPATIALIASELSGVPWSFAAHRWDIYEDNLFHLKTECASFVRFISENGRAIAIASRSVVSEQKAKVVHLGVAVPSMADVVIEQGKTMGTPILLCVAHLDARKAHSDLVQAVKILHDRGICCELWLAGDGLLRRKLEHLVVSSQLDRSVRFLGQLPHSGIIDLYRTKAVTCTVLASLDEGIPVSLMEAMSFGVPVVATGVGGIPELLAGGCGITVPPRDPAALANGIAEVLTDDGVRVGLARAGRQRIEAEYSVEHNVKLLSELLANSGSVQKEVPVLSRN